MDVDENKLEETKVISKNGGYVKDTLEIIERLPDNYPSITIVTGGNDCDSRADTTAEQITEEYGHVIRAAKQKASKVSVASICPRTNSEAAQEKIDSVNAGIRVLCGDIDNVSYVDTTTSFRLGDGAINDGYLHADGVHLTRNGVNKLSQKLVLKAKNQSEGVFRDPRRSGTTRMGQGQRRGDRQNGDPTRGIQPRCFFCYETGHITENCRHGGKLECRRCKRMGHKAKFCHIA